MKSTVGKGRASYCIGRSGLTLSKTFEGIH
jgi:hypothetical protein